MNNQFDNTDAETLIEAAKVSIIDSNLDTFLTVTDILKEKWSTCIPIFTIDEIFETMEKHDRSAFIIESLERYPEALFSEIKNIIIRARIGKNILVRIIEHFLDYLDYDNILEILYLIIKHALPHENTHKMLEIIIQHDLPHENTHKMLEIIIQHDPDAINRLSSAMIPLANRDISFKDEKDYGIISSLIWLEDKTFRLLLERGFSRWIDYILCRAIIHLNLDKVRLIVESEYDYSKNLSIDIILEEITFFDGSYLWTLYNILEYLIHHDFVFEINNKITANSILINIFKLVHLLEGIGVNENQFT